MTTYRGLSNLAEPLKRRIELAVRRIAIEVHTRVVLKSPVDTGRFRGAWVVGVGGIPAAVLDRLDKTGSESIRSAGAQIQAMPFGGRSIYIVNHLPYAQRLEYGWSSQAPQGMVRRTLAEVAAHYGV